jgi:hypothetical protein
MKHQVSRRLLLPADPQVQAAEAEQFFHQFVTQLATAVRTANMDAILYSRQLSVWELNTLQTYAANRMSSSVTIAEFAPTAPAFTIQEIQVEEGTLFAPSSTVSIEEITESASSGDSGQHANLSLVDDASSSALTVAAVGPSRPRGRPRKVTTPLVTTQVRRSPRLNPYGVNQARPSASSGRASSVPRASTPAVL